MTQVCRVCSHPKRKEIEREILAGGVLSAIARKYGVGRDSVWRHKENHIGTEIARQVRRSDQIHATKLLGDLEGLVDSARTILRKAEEDGHSGTALKAIKEVRSTLVALAQISHAMWESHSTAPPYSDRGKGRKRRRAMG
jgi:hypothetical protein